MLSTLRIIWYLKNTLESLYSVLWLNYFLDIDHIHFLSYSFLGWEVGEVTNVNSFGEAVCVYILSLILWRNPCSCGKGHSAEAVSPFQNFRNVPMHTVEYDVFFFYFRRICFCRQPPRFDCPSVVVLLPVWHHSKEVIAITQYAAFPEVFLRLSIIGPSSMPVRALVQHWWTYA